MNGEWEDEAIRVAGEQVAGIKQRLADSGFFIFSHGYLLPKAQGHKLTQIPWAQVPWAQVSRILSLPRRREGTKKKIKD